MFTISFWIKQTVTNITLAQSIFLFYGLQCFSQAFGLTLYISWINMKIHLRWMQIFCYFPVSKQSLNSSPSGSRLLLATCLANGMWQKQRSGFSKLCHRKPYRFRPGILEYLPLEFRVTMYEVWLPGSLHVEGSPRSACRKDLWRVRCLAFFPGTPWESFQFRPRIPGVRDESLPICHPSALSKLQIFETPPPPKKRKCCFKIPPFGFFLRSSKRK